MGLPIHRLGTRFPTSGRASPDGHLQATGRDAKGRKQYRYHSAYREVRDQTKFGRMLAFGSALPEIRRRVEEDLKLPGLPKNKVLATVVRLLETTCMRVGNDEYARENSSYGLTTLQNKHVDISGNKLRFHFRGKSDPFRRAVVVASTAKQSSSRSPSSWHFARNCRNSSGIISESRPAGSFS